MSQPLPHSDIRFCTPEETEKVREEFMRDGGSNLRPDDEVGYILETDLSYPPELMDVFSQFPPLAEKRVVTKDEYSPHTLQLSEKYGVVPSKNRSLKFFRWQLCKNA